MAKSRKAVKNSNQFTAGCIIRNHVTAIMMCIDTLKERKQDAKTRKMIKICKRSLNILLELSILREVDEVLISRKQVKKFAKYR